jgi:hypothetical protein
MNSLSSHSLWETWTARHGRVSPIGYVSSSPLIIGRGSFAQERRRAGLAPRPSLVASFPLGGTSRVKVIHFWTGGGGLHTRSQN